jgi:hypothetical protein
MTRGRAIALGAASAMIASRPAADLAASARQSSTLKQHGRLPAVRMQQIIGAQGNVSSGISSIAIERPDIGGHRPSGLHKRCTDERRYVPLGTLVSPTGATLSRA